MKKYLLFKCLATILLLAGAMSLSSCSDENDKFVPITNVNALEGVYTITGKVYNYNGAVSWTGPPAAIPSSYIGTVNLAPLSPKTATAINSLTTKIDFADFVSPDYYYIFTSPAGFGSISYTLSPVPVAQFSNISKYIVSYTAPSSTQKASWHIMTHYNDNATGTGNSRIVDQTFVQQ